MSCEKCPDKKCVDFMSAKNVHSEATGDLRMKSDYEIIAGGKIIFESTNTCCKRMNLPQID